jgi:GTP-binding protein
MRLLVFKRVMSISIIGRPNVGKSTLFNRLTGTKSAIVSEIPGTTRDRKISRGHLIGIPMDIVDTGGIDDRGAVTIDIKSQVTTSLKSADVVFFMLDARSGVTAIDESIARWIRKAVGKICTEDPTRKIDIVVLANKTEGGVMSGTVINSIDDALRFGLGSPVLISATHGDGLTELAQVVLNISKSRGIFLEDMEKFDKKADISLEERVIQLAIMGRPNVGKSSLDRLRSA